MGAVDPFLVDPADMTFPLGKAAIDIPAGADVAIDLRTGRVTLHEDACVACHGRRIVREYEVDAGRRCEPISCPACRGTGKRLR